jgi:hypothetical protein
MVEKFTIRLVGTAGGPTTMIKVAVPVPAELVAPIVANQVFTAVGVPLMTPVAVFRDRPGGNKVAAKLVGDPEALI